MRLRRSFALGAAVLGAPALGLAADLTVKVEIPRLSVAEYHRPYTAIWLERADQGHVANLAVWYDLKLKNNEGTKWLKDMRQWWRKSGREVQMPLDGEPVAISDEQGMSPGGLFLNATRTLRRPEGETSRFPLTPLPPLIGRGAPDELDREDGGRSESRNAGAGRSAARRVAPPAFEPALR